MKRGDKVLFSGWRIINDGTDEVRVRGVPAVLLDIDRLSQSESGPDRYTIQFTDDGTEQDTVRQCLTEG